MKFETIFQKMSLLLIWVQNHSMFFFNYFFTYQKNGQESPESPTPNKKTFFFQVPVDQKSS